MAWSECVMDAYLQVPTHLPVYVQGNGTANGAEWYKVQYLPPT